MAETPENSQKNMQKVEIATKVASTQENKGHKSPEEVVRPPLVVVKQDTPPSPTPPAKDGE